MTNFAAWFGLQVIRNVGKEIVLQVLVPDSVLRNFFGL
jgi:hypothetical protein